MAVGGERSVSGGVDGVVVGWWGVVVVMQSCIESWAFVIIEPRAEWTRRDPRNTEARDLINLAGSCPMASWPVPSGLDSLTDVSFRHQDADYYLCPAIDII